MAKEKVQPHPTSTLPKGEGESIPAYQVSARKYRPLTFGDVTSQEYITQTLRNAIRIGRVSHAYLFSGPRGVGKTTIARLLAKSLNCTNRRENGEPCNECPSCKEINADNRNHPDVFEIDGASNRNIEDVRELKEKVKYGPVRSRYKIFIIDEVHMLTGASFNALLKTLEEPPSYVVFIFATTSPEKVPLTILGRCQKFDFKRLTIDEITLRLKLIAGQEKIKIDDESLFFIAKKGDGSMRDAQGLFDMAAAYSDNNITFDKLKSFFNLAESDVYFKLTESIKAKDGKELLSYFDSLMDGGYDMQTLLDGLTEHYRNLLIVSSTESSSLVVESESVRKKYEDAAKLFSGIELLNSLKLILQTEYSFKYSANQRTLIEALLIELMKFTDTREISQVLDEIKELKKGAAPSESGGSAGIKPRQTGAYDESDDFPVKKIYEKPVSTERLTAPLQQPQKVMAVDISSAMNELDTHWITIKDQIKTERKWVYSILKDTTFELDGKSNYCIKVDDDNRFDLVDSYKDYLTGIISSYFGKPLPVTIVKNSGSAAEPPVPESTKPATDGDDNFERLKSVLINEFNAKVIE